jgi:hypothetical protein
MPENVWHTHCFSRPTVPKADHGETAMGERPKIDCAVHDLLDKANVTLLLRLEADTKAIDLLNRLRLCANKCVASGHAESALRLLRAAEAIENKLKVTGRSYYRGA